MSTRYPERQLSFARGMRGDMTRAEKMLWGALRGGRLDGMKFRRQTPIGPYIADFLCIEKWLIVELDGPPHEREEQQEHDARRDHWLAERGYSILRIPNEVVIGGGDIVLDKIRAAAGVSTVESRQIPAPSSALRAPSPASGRRGARGQIPMRRV